MMVLELFPKDWDDPLPIEISEKLKPLKNEFKTIQNIPDKLSKKKFAVGVINEAFTLIDQVIILTGETAVEYYCKEKDGRGDIHVLGPKINNKINEILRNLLSVKSLDERKYEIPYLSDTFFYYKVRWGWQFNIEPYNLVPVFPGKYKIYIIPKEQAISEQGNKTALDV